MPQYLTRSMTADPAQLAHFSDILLKRYSSSLKTLAKGRWPLLAERLRQQLPALLALYLPLYGARFDAYYHLEQLLKILAKAIAQRPDYLLAEDAAPQDWHQSEQALGSACYVDLFAGDFQGLKQRIPYLQQTGINYLHLMPLFKAPEPNSDGGYAVSDYRATMPKLGTMTEWQI